MATARSVGSCREHDGQGEARHRGRITRHVFEFYDFFLIGLLASEIAKAFFSG